MSFWVGWWSLSIVPIALFPRLRFRCPLAGSRKERKSRGSRVPPWDTVVAKVRGWWLQRGFVPGSQGNISTSFRYPWMRSQDFFTPKIQQNPMGIFLRRISFCNFRVYFGSQFGENFLVPFPLRFSAVGWHSTWRRCSTIKGGGNEHTDTCQTHVPDLSCDIVV